MRKNEVTGLGIQDLNTRFGTRKLQILFRGIAEELDKVPDSLDEPIAATMNRVRMKLGLISMADSIDSDLGENTRVTK